MLSQGSFGFKIENQLKTEGVGSQNCKAEQDMSIKVTVILWAGFPLWSGLGQPSLLPSSEPVERKASPLQLHLGQHLSDTCLNQSGMTVTLNGQVPHLLLELLIGQS